MFRNPLQALGVARCHGRNIEPLGVLLLEKLGLEAPMEAGMHLGEGSGALMLMPLLEIAREVYNSGQDFERLGIEAYQPLT